MLANLKTRIFVLILQGALYVAGRGRSYYGSGWHREGGVSTEY